MRIPSIRLRCSPALLLVGVFGLLARSAHAFDPSKALTQYLQTSWNTTSGLPQSTVTAITQTTDGYLWLGTQEGLARFDGIHFALFNHRNTPNLASDFIQSLAAGSDGSLWVGTDSGLSHFLPVAGAPQTNNVELLTAANGLTGNSITALLGDGDGGLWVGTTEGLNHIHDGHVETWTVRNGLPDPAIVAMVLDRRGALWIGTSKGLSHFENGHLVTLTTRDGLPSDNISALAAAPDGSVWAGSLAHRVAQIRGGHVFVSSHRLPWNEITALFADREGALWIAFDHHGIGRLYHDRLDLYDASRGLPSDRCSSVLFEDREGSLWLGTLDAGVVQLRDGKFTVYGKPEGLSGNYIDAVLQARDGSMWIGADTEGLNRLLPSGKVEHWDRTRGLPNLEIYSLLETRDGSIWAGYKRGILARIHDGRVTLYRDPEAPDSGLLSLFQDRQGRILVGFGDKGLAEFEDGRFHHLTASGQIRGMAQSADGALWIATDGDGVERFDHGRATRFTDADGLAGNHVMCIAADSEGYIWAGTAAGLSRIHNGHVVTWTADLGLPDSAVGSVLEDERGDLWIGGDSGILHIPRKELTGSQALPLHLVRYGTADGLRSRETLYGTTPTSWKARDGRLWFATIDGVAVIDPAHIPVNSVVPPVWIERVTFNNHLVSVSNGIRLGPGSGNLEVTFTAPSFVEPQQVRFRYRLEGFDADWVATGSRRVAWYTNLPPGKYTFVVQARNNDGLWNQTGASFSFVLRPLPTRTAFAWFCYAALALLGVWAFLVYRTRHLLRRQQELKQTVAERTAQLESEKAALEAARHELHIQATHDSLTGLLNRAASLDHLQREIVRASRDQSPLAVVIADLDHFKDLNDSFGHLCGDDAIREAADRFRSVMRAYDVAGRYGGEEFLMLLPGLDPRMTPARMEELLNAIRSRPFTVGETEVYLTCSIGVATFSPEMDAPSVRDLLNRADTALYAAKKAGRNRCVFEVGICP